MKKYEVGRDVVPSGEISGRRYGKCKFAGKMEDDSEDDETTDKTAAIKALSRKRTVPNISRNKIPVSVIVSDKNSEENS